MALKDYEGPAPVAQINTEEVNLRFWLDSQNEAGDLTIQDRLQVTVAFDSNLGRHHASIKVSDIVTGADWTALIAQLVALRDAGFTAAGFTELP